jgi:hypothetical protein
MLMALLLPDPRDENCPKVPVDIVVSTPERNFGWRREIVGAVEYPAVQEGKVLGARS